MAELPVAAIVCIAVGAYVAVIIAIIIICYVLKSRGKCGESQCCAKEDDAQSCQCCVGIAEACNCCKSPSLKSCLDACCTRKKISCIDVLLCKCCSSDGSSWFDCCKCESKCTEAETCNCLCLEIRLRPPPEKRGGEFSNTLHPTPEPRTAWGMVPNAAGQNFYYPPPQNAQYPFPRGQMSEGLGLDLLWSDRSQGLKSPHTGHSDLSSEFITSTPRHHHGRVDMVIRPGVYSSGRVGFRRQSSKRRSSGRSRSPHNRRSSRVLSPRRPHMRPSLHHEHPLYSDEYLQKRMFISPPLKTTY